jgi:flagellar hook-length control protein FliK
MPHVSVLPVTTTQATDTKAVSQQSSAGGTDADSSFSDVLEQQYAEGTGGKEAKNDSNSKQNDNATAGNVGNSNNTEGVSSDKKTKTNSENNVSNDKVEVKGEESSIVEPVEQVLVTEPKETSQKSNQDVASQLLSFITSSDKILSKSEPKDVPLEVKEQNNEGKTLASLIKGDLFAKNNTIGKQASNHITTEVKTSTKEPISENLTAEQLSIRSAMLKESQPLSSDTTENDLARRNENTRVIDGEVVVKRKPELLVTANNQAITEATKKSTGSEISVEKVISEEDQRLNSDELNRTKQTSEADVSDIKVKNNKVEITGKKDGGSFVNLSAQPSDQSSNEKGVVGDKSADKSVNPSVGMAVNSNSDKTTVSNESTAGNARVINQSTASVMEENNTGRQHQNPENEQQKPSGEEQNVGIDNNEQNTAGVKKQAVITSTEKTNVNSIVEPAVPRTIVADSEGMRVNHNIEAIMSNMTSELSQSQKPAAAALQSETIAIYKKDFTNAVKDKVMVMINQKIQQIEIQLDPAELGNMSIRVNLQNEQAVVSFMVQNQQAKEAVEENIDKLKNMLAESGIDVGDANIEQQDQQTGDDEDQTSQNQKSRNGVKEDDIEQELEIDPAKLVKASSTGVDYYA